MTRRRQERRRRRFHTSSPAHDVTVALEETRNAGQPRSQFLKLDDLHGRRQEGTAACGLNHTLGMPSDHRLRPATRRDEPFLTRMLRHAMNWREGTSNPVELHYVEGFGRAGDVGVIAEVAGEAAGAAWCRLLTGSDRGYGYVADDVPELAIAVEPEYRRRGLATALIEALKAEIAEAGFRAVSLSVEPDNPALRIYERTGFVRCGTEGGSWTMIADL
jgi:ribosomal protein S18 acetylase RimI-like enzyme